MIRCHIVNADAQEQLGATLYRAIDEGIIIYLTGDLGAGKTTLTRGFIQATDFDGAVKSPTYTILEPYEIKGKKILHFDLYRLADPEELEYIGIRDLINDSIIALFEWPAQGEGVIPSADIEIDIVHEKEGRSVSLTALSERGRAVLAKSHICQ